MQEQGVCVMKCNDVTGCEEARLDNDDICRFEGGFLVKCMQWARGAETPCHELICCGYQCMGFRAGCAISANVIANGGK